MNQVPSNVPDTLTGAEIRSHKFPTVFRGLDPEEVRRFLSRLADVQDNLREAVKVALQERDEFAAQASVALQPQARAESVTSDEDPVVVAIREEASSAASATLASARNEANAIVAKANDEAARIVLRARAESRGRALEGSQSDPVFGDAPEDPDAAKEQARMMIQEARAVRERILTDLSKRRKTAHIQLEQLRVAREKLLESLREARRVVDEASRDLSTAEVEARMAAEAAGRRVAAEPLPSSADLSAEVAGISNVYGIRRSIEASNSAEVAEADADSEVVAEVEVRVDEDAEPSVSEGPEVAAAEAIDSAESDEVEESAPDDVAMGADVEVAPEPADEHVSEPMVSEESAPAEEALATDESVEASEPEVVDEESAELLAADQPDNAEAPVVVGELVGSEEPVVLEEPVVTEDVVAAEESVVPVESSAEEAPSTDETVIVEEFVAAEEPAVADDFVAVEEPAVVEELAVVEEPVVADDFVAVEASPSADEPAETELPSAVEVESPADTPPAPEAEAQTEPTPTDKPKRRVGVDDLFARLRAEREQAAANARVVLDDAARSARHTNELAAAARKAHADANAAPSQPYTDESFLAADQLSDEETRQLLADVSAAEVGEFDGIGNDDSFLAIDEQNASFGQAIDDVDLEAQESYVTGQLQSQLVRSVKRHLGDEQSSALSVFRTSRGRADLLMLLGEAPRQHASLSNTLSPFFEDAFRVGSHQATMSDEDVQAAVEPFVAETVGVVVGRIRSEVGDAALATAAPESDASLLNDAISNAYRSWTTDEVAGVASSRLLAAWRAGQAHRVNR